jgi:hypothetical protein
MKKGLLTVLLASLVLVGCQNYDDQFDDLNAQISALKSQVDGLSSLSGQVSSLSGTISGLQSGIAAAQAAATAAGTSADAATAAVNAIPGVDLSGLTASLATLQAEVDAIEAAIASTATAAEVAALQTSLTAVETDLADLLTSNNIYATDITISDAASMAAALALGNKVALVNATVTITDATTVSDTDLQTFINRIKTMNGNFVYSSGSTTGAAPTFDEMVSAKAITLTMAGDISFKKLAGATTIQINDDYVSKITSVDFGALASLTAFNDDGTTANKISLSNATNIDLASLTRHTSSSSLPFTIETKKGATLDLSAFDDVSTTGVQEDLYMELNGPASFSVTNIADGDMGMTNVATVSVSNFFGTLDVNSGVETLTVVDAVNLDAAGATDLTTATLDFAYDYDPALSTAAAAIAAAGYSDTYTQDLADADLSFADLETLTVTGKLLDLYVDGTELVTLSIDATMHDLTIAGATDLTTLTVASGSKIGNISLSGTTNLAVADFNHTSNLTDVDATAQKSVTFYADGNTALTKLHSTGDDVDTLTITDNAVLAELDFTGLADDGAETTPTPGVTIWGNALVASSASNTVDSDLATADTDDGEADDEGSFDDGTSGMDTLKTYLTHIAATAGSTAFVTFDTLSTETDTETTGVSTVKLNITDAGDGATTNEATVLKMTPAVANTADGGSLATTAKRGWYVDQSNANGILKFTVNGAFVPADGYTLTGNQAVDALNIASTANKNLAAAAGVILDAYAKGNSAGTVSLIDYPNTAETSLGERYTSATVSTASTTTGSESGTVWATGLEDEFTLTVGSNSVTASLGGQSVTGTTVEDIEEAIVKAWAAKYGSAGTASLSAIATMADDGDGILEFTMLQADSGGFGVAVDFEVENKSANPTGTDTSSKTSGNIGYMIGATTASNDNSTIANSDTGLIVTLTSPNSGTLQNAVLSAATTNVVSTDGAIAATMVEYTTTYTSNSTWSGAVSDYTGVSQPRTDVVTAEASVDAATSNATDQVKFNRVAWLG